MANKKEIKKHSDQNFVTNFTRYFFIDKLLECNSWGELRRAVKKLDREHLMDDFFNEFKMFNLVIYIEQALCNLLDHLFQNNCTDNDRVYKYLQFQIKKYRGIKKDERAREILDEEIENKIENIYNSHILLYVCGLSLGGFINIIREFTNDFNRKRDLLELLSKFNEYRTDLIHNLLSSRNNSKEQNKDGIKTGVELKNMIDEITIDEKKELSKVNVKIKKLKNVKDLLR